MCRAVFLSVAASLFRMMILLVAHLIVCRRAIAIGVVFVFLVLFRLTENVPLLDWPTAVIIAAVIALGCLETACREKDASLILLGTPWFDALRPEPRFQEVLREVRLPSRPASPPPTGA
jgi:hypothetical protein